MASSPLHAGYPESRHKHSSSIQNTPYHASSLQSPDVPDGARAAASPSRHTRRLRLRNAGFRGATLPTRAVSPTSHPSTSTNWSTVSGLQQLSDAENVSPLSGKRVRTESTATNPLCVGNMRESSGGVLQDIGNSATLKQTTSKRARSRVTSGNFWAAPSTESIVTNKRQSLVTDEHPSPPVQDTPAAWPRSARTSRTKMGKPRRSVSAETRKYVDHLEQQLSEAQTQLSVMTSPTVTREQSSRMRHLNAETKQLQEEVAAWESKYEDRIQEALDKHYQVEASLQTRVRTLEEEANVADFRMRDLEIELETTKESLEAVEAANVNLEKRLEIMSELLAASPTKIDLHAPTPGRLRQNRPQSMLPRFPTAGSLAGSPEHPSSRAHATSPSSPISRFSPAVPLSPSNLVFSPEVTSDDGSDRSDMNSVVVAPPGTRKPMRRMRRFGAGSIGPKPLILPSTSHCEQIPASAPPFDRDEAQAAFPFSPQHDAHRLESSPRSDHRRASSEASPMPPFRLPPSPFTSFETAGNDHTLPHHTTGFRSPPSRLSLITTTRDFSSMGSATGAAVGRNLMEELTAVRSSDAFSDEEQLNKTHGCESAPRLTDSTPFHSVDEDASRMSLAGVGSGKNCGQEELPVAVLPARLASASSAALVPSTAYGTLWLPEPPRVHSSASSMSFGVRTNTSISTLDSLRTVFSNLFRSPVELAKHLVQTAQSRMHIPRPLLTVQWWLVGVLLGPMARRRMLGRSPARCTEPEDCERRLLDEPMSSNDPEDALAFGKAYQTPQSTVSSQSRTRNLVAGMGKKRMISPSSSASNAKSVTLACPHHRKRFKHHPWLWLKFSMTLAIAVGVAFKDGPSSLLKDAACRCKQSGQKTSVASGGNWRSATRDPVLLMPSTTSLEESNETLDR